jgi:hypothetical protein
MNKNPLFFNKEVKETVFEEKKRIWAAGILPSGKGGYRVISMGLTRSVSPRMI